MLIRGLFSQWQFMPLWAIRPVRLLALVTCTLGPAWSAQVPSRGSVSIDIAARPAHETLSLLNDLSGLDHELEAASLNALAGTKVSCVLVLASPDAQRQALAHALDRWWSITDSGRTIYGSQAYQGSAIRVVRYTSSISDDASVESSVRQLMQPWLAETSAVISR